MAKHINDMATVPTSSRSGPSEQHNPHHLERPQATSSFEQQSSSQQQQQLSLPQPEATLPAVKKANTSIISVAKTANNGNDEIKVMEATTLLLPSPSTTADFGRPGGQGPTLLSNGSTSMEEIYQGHSQQQQQQSKTNSFLAPVLTTFFGAVTIGSCIAFLIFLKRRKNKNGKANRVYVYDNDVDSEKTKQKRKEEEEGKQKAFFAQPPAPQSITKPIDIPDTTITTTALAYNDNSLDDDRPAYAKAVYEAYRDINKYFGQCPSLEPSRQQQSKKKEEEDVSDVVDNTKETTTTITATCIVENKDNSDQKEFSTEDTMSNTNRATNDSYVKAEREDSKLIDINIVVSTDEKHETNRSSYIALYNDTVDVDKPAEENEKMIQLLPIVKMTAHKHDSWQTFITAHTTPSIYVDARTSFAASSTFNGMQNTDEDTTESDGTTVSSVNSEGNRDSWVKRLEMVLSKNTHERREAVHQRA
ncbi:hypothetical protein BDF20DRAFT_863171 [Mycotypha africana]|uniref:uncharacterized protein n=1 Tax=Mycotypha africana TaxID=64632 RepID=UPI0023016EEF|nr:uncharacterized protein BDF20DRAFT_863171 [Mycotypha africana]KAI8981779.1 hypothetical protein BDF20DRAFT_863171 [Mycotypha africana]